MPVSRKNKSLRKSSKSSKRSKNIRKTRKNIRQMRGGVVDPPPKFNVGDKFEAQYSTLEIVEVKYDPSRNTYEYTITSNKYDGKGPIRSLSPAQEGELVGLRKIQSVT
jgi:hypothetical protein